MLLQPQRDECQEFRIDATRCLRRVFEWPLLRVACGKCFVNLICIASLTMSCSNICDAASALQRNANLRNPVVSPFSLGCASSSIGVCQIDLGELPAGEVHLKHISGFSADADANVIPVFSDGGALFHVLPWQSYSQDSGDGLDVLYSQSVDLVWEADSIFIGEPGASSVVARVFGHVVLDASGSLATPPTSFFSVPEPGSATTLAGLTFLLAFHRRLRRLTGV